VALHAVAPFVLYGGARAGGIGAPAAFGLATAALLSQAGLLSVGQVMPESPAISFLLIAFGGALAASRSVLAFGFAAIPVALAAGAAYVLRPSHVAAIAVIPIMFWLFARRNSVPRPALRATVLLLMMMMPFLALSAVRLKAVGDFNIVSFGGFQMSPMAAFILAPDTIAELPERIQATARGLVAAREAAQADGVIPRTPLDRPGDRFFVTTAYGYFDVYARGYDPVLHFGIVKLQRPDESFVAFNRRLMEASIATVAAAPLRWAVWVAGASARLAGRALVLNVPMAIALGLLLAVAGVAFVRRIDLPPGGDVGAACIVAAGWFASTGALAVLVTFPAARYADTAAVLLPAVPLAISIALLAELRRAIPPLAR
jgi:hypothetical protein